MRPSLLIMAAGIGSRFGGGIKQLVPVGEGGEIIMDYSVHDAIAAGYGRIIFVIRKEIEADFREVIGSRIEKVCAARGVEVCYAFQELSAVPGRLPEGRKKPWGTGQAVLSAKSFLDGPFAVINADDYYGREAFVRMYSWLAEEHAEREIAMAGFVLKNTLSDNGGVTRGICRLSEDGVHIADVTETKNIVRTENGAEADGVRLDPESIVSMNFWGFPGVPPFYVRCLEDGFRSFFLETVPTDPLKAEYLLPIHIGELLRHGQVTVTYLKTWDSWFGVTYREDQRAVSESFRKLTAEGVYAAELYSDLLY